jgi:hypothetical protein
MREQVIASIEARTNTFYTLVPGTGKRADVGVVRPAGRPLFCAKMTTDLRSGATAYCSGRDIYKSAFARFSASFDFRLLQQYLPKAETRILSSNMHPRAYSLIMGRAIIASTLLKRRPLISRSARRTAALNPQLAWPD